VIECLPGKCEALIQTPVLKKKERKKEGRERGREEERKERKITNAKLNPPCAGSGRVLKVEIH
jgi:hypothetical protein